MNVIVIGSGAREHALCRILDKSYLCEKVFCFPGNYGISQIAECRNISTKEDIIRAVSYTHLRAHETKRNLV